jgi:hypothetical protein
MTAGMGGPKKAGDAGWYMETNAKAQPGTYQVILRNKEKGAALKGLLLYAELQEKAGQSRKRGGVFHDDKFPKGFKLHNCEPEKSTISHSDAALKAEPISFDWTLSKEVEVITFRAIIVVADMADWYILEDVNIFNPTYKGPVISGSPIAEKEDRVDLLEWNIFDGYFIPSGADAGGYVMDRLGRDKCREICQERKDCAAFTVRKSDGFCSLKTEFSLKEDKDWITEHKQFLRPNISDNFFSTRGLTVRRKSDLTKIVAQQKGSIMVSMDFFREQVSGEEIVKALSVLTEVDGDLVLMNLPTEISHINFLPSLTTVTGVLEVSNNDYICSLELPALQRVGDVFTITMNNNPCLHEIGTIGTSAGVWVGNMLEIAHNGHLSSSSIKQVVDKVASTNPEVEVYVDELGVSL